MQHTYARRSKWKSRLTILWIFFRFYAQLESYLTDKPMYALLVHQEGLDRLNENSNLQVTFLAYETWV